jgi:hypothetical protein
MLVGGAAIDRDGTILDETSRNIRPRERGSDGTGIVTTPRIPRLNSLSRRATQRPGLIHGIQMADDTDDGDKHENKKSRIINPLKENVENKGRGTIATPRN